jgi:hypothetical protein
MNIHIGDVTGTVRAVDGDSLLAPQTMQRIVNAVLAAIDEAQRQKQRADADTRVTRGVAAEQEDAQ